MRQFLNRSIQATIILLIAAMSLSSCQESLQEKAAREAKDYTRKYCPTPTINCTSTDSVAFDTHKNSFIYYVTFSDKLDDKEIIDLNKDRIKEALMKSVKESTQMKPYVEAGCHFHYFCRSKKDPDIVLFEVIF